MAQGCIPILSDLPANRELVRDGDNGIVLRDGEALTAARLQPLLARAEAMAADNRAWVAGPRAVRALRAALRRAPARAVNILYINHYAGSPALGMEYRPYYLAREWVRAGHRVQMLAADFSHVRAHAAAGRRPASSTASPTAGYATPPYQGNGLGRVRNIWAFLRAVWRDTPRLRARVPARRGDRLQHLPDGHLGRAPHRAPRRREAGLRGARPVAAEPDRAVGHVAPPPLHRARAGGRGRGLPGRRPRGLDAAQGARTTWPRAGSTCSKLHIVPNGITLDEWQRRRRRRCAPTWPQRCRPRARPARTVVGYAGSMGLPNALDTLLDAAALLRDAAAALRAGRRRPRTGAAGAARGRRRAGQRAVPAADPEGADPRLPGAGRHRLHRLAARADLPLRHRAEQADGLHDGALRGAALGGGRQRPGRRSRLRPDGAAAGRRRRWPTACAGWPRCRRPSAARWANAAAPSCSRTTPTRCWRSVSWTRWQ